MRQRSAADHLARTIESVPSFHIESAYLPAREVGGDFFQVMPISSCDDSQRQRRREVHFSTVEIGRKTTPLTFCNVPEWERADAAVAQKWPDSELLLDYAPVTWNVAEFTPNRQSAPPALQFWKRALV